MRGSETRLVIVKSCVCHHVVPRRLLETAQELSQSDELMPSCQFLPPADNNPDVAPVGGLLMPCLRFIPLFALLLLAVPALAEDWPGWLGPRRDGSSTAVVKPWKGDLEVVWKKRVGEGHSSPIVWKGKVYLHTKVVDDEAEAVTAYDAKTGKVAWTKSYPRTKFKSLFGAGPQSTPTRASDSGRSMRSRTSRRRR